MQERDFVQLLQERARAQKKELEAVPFPKLFSFVLVWLSDHPWRFLIPLAFIISLVLRGVIGHEYTNFVLGIFRSI
jgi:hypothetical protein